MVVLGMDFLKSMDVTFRNIKMLKTTYMFAITYDMTAPNCKSYIHMLFL